MATADALKPRHGMPSEKVSVKRARSVPFFNAVLDAAEARTGESKAQFRFVGAYNADRCDVETARAKFAGKGKANG